jgi:Cu+-exporting ATPase
VARPTVSNAKKESPMVKDPVCGMMIEEKDAAGKSEYQGQTYYFCAHSCKTRFDENPQRYIGRDR